MATIFINISPNGENRRLMLIDSWVEDPDSVEMMDNPVDGDRVAVRSHNSLNEIVVDSVKVYDNGSWVDEGGGGGGGGGGTLLFSGSYTTTSAMGMNVANLTPLAETLTDGHLPTTLSVDLNGTVVDLPAIMDGDNHTGTWGEVSGETPVFTTYPCFMFVQSSSPWSNINMALPASGSGTVSVTGVIPE